MTGTVEIDQQARERAEEWIADFVQKIGEAEAVLATLGGFIGENSLGSSVVGSIGIKVGETREQVPHLLQVIRDLDPDFEEKG